MDIETQNRPNASQPMNRVLIIGNAGSGKTTFSRKLAKKQKLPLIHLDQLYWYGNWEHLSRDAFDAALQTELEKPKWVLDGNFNRTIPHRLQYCDTVFFFDLPAITCVAGVIQRLFKNWGKSRPDMGGNCVERFDRQKISFCRNVLTFNKQHRADYYQLLASATHAKVYVFRSRRQANAFLKESK